MPDACFEDETELRRWMRIALEASRRAEATKRAKVKDGVATITRAVAKRKPGKKAPAKKASAGRRRS